MIRRASESAAAVTAALAVLLASTGLSRAYTDMTYLLPVLSAIVVAFAFGWFGRRLDVPASLAPAVSFVGLIEYLTIAYFRDSAFLGFIPTPQVFRDAGAVIQLGARDINQLAAPVVPTRELLFITVAGVFAVAVVVDLIALRLRRPVLAGLPLLTLFVIPSSLSPTGAGWVAFSLAAAGYLALLTIEGRDRVHRWGRRLAATRQSVDDGYRKPVARAARGIGAAAIGFALVVPGLTPGLENGILTGTGASSGSGSGIGTSRRRTTTISPVVELNKLLKQTEEVELIRVRTALPQYLRMAVLDTFTGAEWNAAKTAADRLDANKPIAPPPGLTETIPRQTVTSEIMNSKRHSGKYLPVPYSPARVTGLRGKGTWRYDDARRVIESSNKSISGLNYTVESVVVTPDPLLLDDSLAYPAEIAPLTKLAPNTVDPSVVADAQRITKAASTNWARVVTLQNWFSRDGGFEYSITKQPGTGGDVLKAFLRDKVGYCEQYAAAMAVMVRALGIPSRVVVGFTAGTPKDGYYSITNRDAHAWPEVYFTGVGWVRFEPTPPGAGRAAVSAPDESLIMPTAAPTPSASASPSSSAGADGPDLTGLRQPDDFEQRRGVPNAGSDFVEGDAEISLRPLLVAAVLFLMLLIPIVPALTRSARRRRARTRATTPRTRSHVAWRHLYDDAHDLGFGWPSSASPRVAASALIAGAHLDAGAVAAVRRLAVAEENARYAPDSYVAASTPDYDSDVAVIRAALLAGVSWRLRLRALVFPATTLSVISRSIHVWSASAGAAVAHQIERAPSRFRTRSS